MHKRDLPWRSTKEPYRVWVSEVMLQQTQVKTVLPYYDHFLGRFPDINSLAAADQQAVLKAWEGLGYYARARNFHRAAMMVVQRHGGVVPEDWDAFHALPGVGDYIAAAVLSISFDQPYAVVDGNVKRVLARLYEIPEPVNDGGNHRKFKQIADLLLNRKNPAVHNQAMMELGALVCRLPRPECGLCPIAKCCRAKLSGAVEQFPVRKKRAPVPEHRIAVGVVQRGGRILITRRKPDGLLGGLWEFPGGKIEPGESAASACVREIGEETGYHVTAGRHVARIRHAYTHFKIRMDVFLCDYTGGKAVLNGPTAFCWIAPHEMDDYPFPGANHKFIPMLKAYFKEKPPEIRS